MTQPLRRVYKQRRLSWAVAGRHPVVLAAKRTGSTIDSRLATSQVKHPNCGKDRTVAKPELGTKRLCASCGAKFYDLNKDPIHCPKCGAVYEVVVARPTRPEAPAPAAVAQRPPPPAEEVAAPEPQEVETVSLEEADAESQGAAAKKPAPTEPAEEAEEEEVEMDESLDDDTFIEEQDEEDADVTDIIGGDRENEEEG